MYLEDLDFIFVPEPFGGVKNGKIGGIGQSYNISFFPRQRSKQGIVAFSCIWHHEDVGEFAIHQVSSNFSHFIHFFFQLAPIPFINVQEDALLKVSLRLDNGFRASSETTLVDVDVGGVMIELLKLMPPKFLLHLFNLNKIVE